MVSSVDTRIRVNNEMDLLPSTVEPLSAATALLQPHHLSTNPPNMENFLEENKFWPQQQLITAQVRGGEGRQVAGTIKLQGCGVVRNVRIQC